MTLKNYTCDCHCDSVLNVVRGEGETLLNEYNVSREGPFLQLFAAWTENGSGLCDSRASSFTGIDPKDVFALAVKMVKTVMEKAPAENMTLCVTKNDVRGAVKAGKNIAMAAMEGCGCVDSLEKLHMLRELGVRFATLTWNPSNILASGCSSSGTPDDKGLTEYGREFVKECGKLGIAVDLSHASVKTMRDVLEEDSCAVFASHSNFRSVCDHVRNLPDDVAEEIVRRGGFIGLNTYLPFVAGGISYGEYDAEMIFPHIYYAAEKGWLGALGFGFDIDGVEAYARNVPLDRSIHDTYARIIREKSGLDEKTQIAIRGGNFLEFVGRKLG